MMFLHNKEMIIRRPIGEKGQVVIPRDLRRLLRLKREVVFEVRGNDVIMKSEQDPKEFLKDFLDVPKIKRGRKTVKEMILEQYDE